MHHRVVRSSALVSILALPFSSLWAQQALRNTEPTEGKPTPPAASAPTSVPALVPYSGFGVDADGKAITGEVPVTFLIYKDEVGGDPLFTESQTASFDPAGHYAVNLGATLSSGIPLSLFSSGDARWLEVQIAGAKVQPRALLVSVPYALKAGDASTLGGLPASAYALAGSSQAKAVASDITSATITPDTVTNVTTTGGTSGYIPFFNGTSTIVNSKLFQSASGIGIGDVPNTNFLFDVNGKSILRGTTNLTNNGIATSSAGKDSFQLSFSASGYNSTSKAAAFPIYYLQAEPTGNNTSAPGATMNLLYSATNGAGTETGLYFNPNGTVHFAAGQTFPGTGAGTITGVTAGTGLTGGGTSGKVTLSLNPSVVAELAGTNSFTGSDTFVASLYEDLDINIDNKNTNSGGISPGLRLGSASGEGMASKRTAGGNQYGVDLFTDYKSRLAINEAGQVAIGTADTFSNAQLDVVSANGDGADFTGYGFGYGVRAVGASTPGYGPGFGGSFTGGASTGSGDNESDGATGLYVTGGSANGTSGGIGIESNGGYSSSGSPFAGGLFQGGDSGSGFGGDGIVADPGYSSSNGNNDAYAARLNGEVMINGTVHSDVATATIDHPLDPANKSLNLTSIQSSEMVNIFSGNVTTDEQGLATVQLPSWFEAVNGDLRYQLTTVGHKAQAWVAKEVKDGSFQIASDMANVKISWQITGVRQDAYAKAHPLVVEQEKGVRERGFYRHPELYGQPATKQTEWGRHPREMRALQLAKQKKTVLTAVK